MKISVIGATGAVGVQILKDLDSPLVVLKAGQYTQEIKNDIIKNINSSTRFIL